jgi:hypothetical protein
MEIGLVNSIVWIESIIHDLQLSFVYQFQSTPQNSTL